MGRKPKLVDNLDEMKKPKKRKKKKYKKKKGPKARDRIPGYVRLKAEEIQDEPAHRLAIDVVIMSVDDYVKYSKKLFLIKWKARRKLIPRDKKYYTKLYGYRKEVILCKKFFFSDRFAIFCDLNPNELIEHLDKEIESYGRSERFK